MLEERTPAIVLRGRPHGESDKIVTFLTKDWGKVTGIAKGAKRSQRRFVNVLEPFTHVQLRFRPSRPHHADELAFIFGCDLRQSFRGPSRDLQRFALASYCSELIDVMVTGQEAGEEIYALLLDSLQGLETTDPISPAFLPTFELLLLTHTGYALI
jgi:DNA repair protein RecO (recombination protein O)